MVRGPDNTDRVVVIGPTGCGKTQFAASLLSTRNFDEVPWIIIDYKGEDLIEDILKVCGDGIKDIDVNKPPPKEPGLYYMKVRPMLDDVAIELFLQRVYDRASNGKKRISTGLFLDEGYALPRNSKFFDIILTQGRSLRIPVICLYQRPVHMSRFAVSQSTFRAVFKLHDRRDAEVASQFIKPAIGENGKVFDVFSVLPKYYCLWYDVAEGETTVLRPAPSRDRIIETFRIRLKPVRKRALI